MFPLLLAVSFAGFHLVERGARGDWYVPDDRPGLKVDVKGCEKFLGTTEKAFDIVIPRFTYRRVRTAADVSLHGGAYAAGVADAGRGTIVSVEPCSKHEIAHLVTGKISDPDKMFEEGIAAMLGGDYWWPDRWMARRSARSRGARYGSVEHSFRRPVVRSSDYHFEYVLADSWVRHLVKKYGMPKLVAFFRECSKRKSTRRTFLLTYGVGLDEEFNLWLYGKKGPKSRRR